MIGFLLTRKQNQITIFAITLSQALVAWASGIVSACGDMGREIESRQ
jgi:hypothetical protein